MKEKIFWASWIILFTFFYISLALWAMSDYNAILKTLLEILFAYLLNFLIVKFQIKKNKKLLLVLYVINISIFIKILLYKTIFSITISSLMIINIRAYFE
jgi:hypothetical protein